MEEKTSEQMHIKSVEPDITKPNKTYFVSGFVINPETRQQNFVNAFVEAKTPQLAFSAFVETRSKEMNQDPSNCFVSSISNVD